MKVDNPLKQKEANLEVTLIKNIISRVLSNSKKLYTIIWFLVTIPIFSEVAAVIIICLNSYMLSNIPI